MKKLVCILLTLTMVMSLSMVAFADSSTVNSLDSGNTKTIDVTASVTENNTADIVYYVEIEWALTGDLELVNTNTYTWDPATLKYTKAETPSLSVATDKKTASAEFTITNKSNAAVGYDIKYAKNQNIQLVSAFSKGQNDCDSPTGNLARADNAYASYLTEGASGYTVSSGFDASGVTNGDATTAYVKMDGGISNYNAIVQAASVTVGTFTITISTPTA